MRGSRARVHYRTRTWIDPEGNEIAVWGDNRGDCGDVHTHTSALVRIIGVHEQHVVVQPDKHLRHVAIHICDVIDVASPIVRTRS